MNLFKYALTPLALALALPGAAAYAQAVQAPIAATSALLWG